MKKMIGQWVSDNCFMTITLLAVCLTMILFRYKRNSVTTKKPWLPYAPVGMLETIQRIAGSEGPQFILETAQKMQRYTFRLSVPLCRYGVYSVNEASLAREILLDPTTDKAEQLYSGFTTISGRQVMANALNTPYMRGMRKGTAHAFSQKEVRRMNSVAGTHADHLCKRIADKKVFDPTIETTWLTFMVMFEAAFEYIANEKEFLAFNHNVEVVFRELLLKPQVNPLRSLFGGLLFPEMKIAYKCRDELQAFMQKVLVHYQHLANPSPAKTLIQLIDHSEHIRGDQDQKVAELLVWAIGGFDTTGFSLSNMLILLAQNPHVQQRLRTALGSAQKNKPLHTVDYFQYVVKEAMRLVPVAATGSVRQTGRDFDTGDGFMIPKGAVCFFGQYAGNHNPAIFEEPEVFRPERWEHPTTAMKAQIYPFSVGKRNCPGQSLAISEINLALPRLVQEFFFEVVEKGELDSFTTLKLWGFRLKATKITP